MFRGVDCGQKGTPLGRVTSLVFLYTLKKRLLRCFAKAHPSSLPKSDARHSAGTVGRRTLEIGLLEGTPELQSFARDWIEYQYRRHASARCPRVLMRV